MPDVLLYNMCNNLQLVKNGFFFNDDKTGYKYFG